MLDHLLVATSEPERAAQRYVEVLASHLQDFDLQVEGLSVRVNIGVFRLFYTTVHPFKGVSSVLFRVTPQREYLIVDYTISLTGLAWTLFAFGLLATAYALSFPWAWMNFVGPPCGVALAFGLNWLWSRLAIRLFLRRIAKETQAMARHGEHPRHLVKDAVEPSGQ